MSSPEEVLIDLLLCLLADGVASLLALQDAVLQQSVGLLHLCKLELQLVHLVLQLVL